jgi:hypothetical protein
VFLQKKRTSVQQRERVMPDVALYQQGFNIQIGQIYADYRLNDIKISHVQEKLFS